MLKIKTSHQNNFDLDTALTWMPSNTPAKFEISKHKPEDTIDCKSKHLYWLPLTHSLPADRKWLAMRYGEASVNTP